MTARTRLDTAVGELLANGGAQRVAARIAHHYLGLAAHIGVREANSGPLEADSSGTDLLLALGDLAGEIGDAASATEFLTAAATPAESVALQDRLLSPNAALPADLRSDTMFAFYDLDKGPLTYDFIQYLVLAERFRVAAGKRNLHVVIVPGRHEGFRNESPRDRFLNAARKEWRLRQLIVRACDLTPSCTGVTRMPNRAEAGALLARIDAAGIFPPAYSVDAPTCPYLLPFVLQFAANGPDIRSLEAPPVVAALVRNLFDSMAGSAPVITITVRQSDFQPERNSRIDAWMEFAASARDRGFCPVFIPDTEAVLREAQAEMPGFHVFPLAALSMAFRAAAYQESWFNMMTSNGPYTLCFYNARARCSVFKLIVPGVATASARFHIHQGLQPGAQLPFAGPLQRLIWEDDSAPIIEREFAEIRTRLDGIEHHESARYAAN